MTVDRYGPRGQFFVGDFPHQMYVEYQLPDPDGATHDTPIALIHGGCVTGASYWSTPDERKGWAQTFLDDGWTVYVVDWPGHGRSPIRPPKPIPAGLTAH